MSGISVKLPLQHDDSDGHYVLNKSLKDSIRQNFKVLLMTCPGERIMKPNFGVGLRNYLFEMFPEAEISAKIHEQIGKFMPFLVIKKISFKKEENKLFCRVLYEIPTMFLTDSIDVVSTAKEIG